jgi:heptosyltransferase-2
MTQPARILFICMGGIGDIVALTPVLSLFSAKFPGAAYHFLFAKNGGRALIERHPQTRDIIEITSAKSDFWRACMRIRRLKPDLVFSANGTNPLNCGLIGLLAGAGVRAGESFGAGRFLYNVKVPVDPRAHEVDRNMAIARAVAPSNDAPVFFIHTSPQEREAARLFMQELDKTRITVGIHAGSGPAMAFKRWPAERFVALSKRIMADFPANILLFGGADERDLTRALAEAGGPAARSIAGRFTIRESWEIMKQCRLFVSNDSGPMHMAYAAGCPTIAIFGPTQDFLVRPYGPAHRIVTAPMACRPCYWNGKKITCDHCSCLTAITVDMVMEQVRALLSDK